MENKSNYNRHNNDAVTKSHNKAAHGRIVWITSTGKDGPIYSLSMRKCFFGTDEECHFRPRKELVEECKNQSLGPKLFAIDFAETSRPFIKNINGVVTVASTSLPKGGFHSIPSSALTNSNFLLTTFLFGGLAEIMELHHDDEIEVMNRFKIRFEKVKQRTSDATTMSKDKSKIVVHPPNTFACPTVDEDNKENHRVQSASLLSNKPSNNDDHNNKNNNHSTKAEGKNQDVQGNYDSEESNGSDEVAIRDEEEEVEEDETDSESPLRFRDNEDSSDGRKTLQRSGGAAVDTRKASLRNKKSSSEETQHHYNNNNKKKIKNNTKSKLR
eukprot:TRINITY_DN4744_c0_g1_i1.p1 TRINITY_DN4744_c0_g1~~TRINITY_DN4744_c0_g1_i1.p1  ORF type:complete len:327 (+),score=81.26 TRINITY_DN4744_c0_g1_i1:3-983(+)